ncbi:Staygreen protein-domain-containing protein [Haematococcus lacustris]
MGALFLGARAYSGGPWGPSRSAMRQLSSKETAGAQRCSRAVCRVARPRAKRTLRVAAIFDPPPFQPEKLTVSWQKGTTRHHSSAGLPRKYTLTHNDITGALQLTVGSDFNYAQISGFYTRLLRDEVVAEWAFDPRPVLHIYCHVSGEDRWLAPPFLRNYIFRREIPLVLEAFMWADKELLLQHPELANADVLVHFQSSSQELDSVEVWGVLSQRSTWQPVPTSILKRMLSAVMGDQLWGMGRGASSQPLLTQSSQQACTDLEVDASAQAGMLSERDLVPVPIAVDAQGSAGRQAGAGSWTLRPSDLVLVPPDLEQHHSLTHSLAAPGTSQPASPQSARQMQVGQRQGQQQGMVPQETHPKAACKTPVAAHRLAPAACVSLGTLPQGKAQ